MAMASLPVVYPGSRSFWLAFQRLAVFIYGMNQKGKADKNEVLVIPNEAATFWMDGNGCWHNRHGPFENKKIIQYFNAAIQYDEKGYHVAQERDGIVEKVYFPFEDTALFVVDVKQDDQAMLVLNTGRQIPLNADKLFICGDDLYGFEAGERIKFKARALIQLSKKIVYEKGSYYFVDGGRHQLIPTVSMRESISDGHPE